MEDVKIILPDHYCRWEKEGWFLYFDPTNFSWIKVNKDGSSIIENIRKYSSLIQVIEKLSSIYNVSREEISSSLKDFVDNSLALGFLHKDSYKKIELKDSLPRYPNDLYLSVTNRCPLNCVYCYNKKDRNNFEDRYEMSFNEYLNIIEEAVELGIKRVVFTGGEPMIYSPLFEIARKAKNFDMSTELLTNGVMINNRNCKQVVDAFDMVTVSLDSHIKEIHDKQRGAGTFEKTVNALEMLREAGAKSICVTIVVTRDNIKHILEYYRFAYENLRVDNVIKQVCLPYDVTNSGKGDDLMPSFDQIYIMEEQVNEYLKGKGKEKKEHPLLRRVTCGAGTAEIGIAPNGDVFPCHILHKEEFLCGNLRNQSLKDIFENSSTLKFFRSLTVQKIGECSKCDLRHVCGGGCRALAYSISGKIDGYNHLLCKYLRKKAINKLWASSEFPLKNIKHGNPKTSEIPGNEGERI